MSHRLKSDVQTCLDLRAAHRRRRNANPIPNGYLIDMDGVIYRGSTLILKSIADFVPENLEVEKQEPETLLPAA